MSQQLNLNREDLVNLKCLNLYQSKRNDFGRRLYQVQFDEELYWLKTHLKGHNLECQQSFLNELSIYQLLNNAQAKFILPFELIDLSVYNLTLALDQQTQPTSPINFDDDNQCIRIDHSVSPNGKTQYLDQALIIVNSFALFSSNPDLIDRDAVVNILISSLNVLEQMHKIGFLHGDLKIEHFRTLKNNSYLIDFEQSCLIDDAQMMKNSATPRYMAPELFHAKQKTMQTDIYALGIIWFEWLTQKKITQKSYLDWAKWHCQIFNVELFGKYEFLQQILKAMLEKNKVNRCVNIYQIKQILSRSV